MHTLMYVQTRSKIPEVTQVTQMVCQMYCSPDLLVVLGLGLNPTMPWNPSPQKYKKIKQARAERGGCIHQRRPQGNTASLGLKPAAVIFPLGSGRDQWTWEQENREYFSWCRLYPFLFLTPLSPLLQEAGWGLTKRLLLLFHLGLQSLLSY